MTRGANNAVQDTCHCSGRHGDQSPTAALAQTVGVAPGESVVVTDAPGIAVEQRPAFRGRRSVNM